MSQRRNSMKLTGLIFFVIFLASCAHPSSPPVHTMPWSANERAIPVLQEKLKADPGNADLNASLGQAYLQKARETGDPSYYTKSEQLFGRALASNADHVDALIGKASLAMSRHEFTAARDVAQHAAE